MASSCRSLSLSVFAYDLLTPSTRPVTPPFSKLLENAVAATPVPHPFTLLLEGGLAGRGLEFAFLVRKRRRNNRMEGSEDAFDEFGG